MDETIKGISAPDDNIPQPDPGFNVNQDNIPTPSASDFVSEPSMDEVSRAVTGSGVRSFRAGVLKLNSAYNALAAQAGLTVGAEEFAKRRFQNALEDDERGNFMLEGTVQDPAQIKDIGSLYDFTVNQLAGMAPSLVPAIAGGIITKRPFIGPTLGFSPQMTGEQIQRLRANPEIMKKYTPGEVLAASTGTGVTQAALFAGVGGVGQVARTVAGQGVKAAAPKFLPTAAKMGAGQATAMVGADIAGQAGEKAMDPNKEIDLSQVPTEAAIGLATGPLFAVPGYLAGSLRARLGERKPPTDRYGEPPGSEKVDDVAELAKMYGEMNEVSNEELSAASATGKYDQFKGWEDNIEKQAEFGDTLMKDYHQAETEPKVKAATEALKGTKRQSLMRTQAQLDIHDKMLEDIPALRHVDPAERIKLADSIYDAILAAGDKDTPVGHPEGMMSYAQMDKLTNLLTYKGMKDLMTFAVNAVHQDKPSRALAKSRVKDIMAAGASREKDLLPRIRTVLSTYMKPEHLASPEDRATVMDVLAPLMLRYLNGAYGEAAHGAERTDTVERTRFDKAMTEAFGENKDKAIEALDTLREDRTALDIEQRAPEEDTRTDEERQADEEAGVTEESKKLEEQRNVIADKRLEEKFPQTEQGMKDLEVLEKELTDEWGKKGIRLTREVTEDGMLQLRAESAMEADPLTAVEWDQVREPEKFGKSKPEDGIFTVKSITDGKSVENKINLIRGTRLMMQREGRSIEGNRSYVADMFNRFMSALMASERFRDIKDKYRTPEGGWDIPDNTVVAVSGGKRYTYKDIKEIGYPDSDTARALRKAHEAAPEGPEKTKAGAKLSAFYARSAAARAMADKLEAKAADALEDIQNGKNKKGAPRDYDEAVAPLKAALEDANKLETFYLQKALDRLEIAEDKRLGDVTSPDVPGSMEARPEGRRKGYEADTGRPIGEGGKKATPAMPEPKYKGQRVLEEGQTEPSAEPAKLPFGTSEEKVQEARIAREEAITEGGKKYERFQKGETTRSTKEREERHAWLKEHEEPNVLTEAGFKELLGEKDLVGFVKTLAENIGDEIKESVAKANLKDVLFSRVAAANAWRSVIYPEVKAALEFGRARRPDSDGAKFAKIVEEWRQKLKIPGTITVMTEDEVGYLAGHLLATKDQNIRGFLKGLTVTTSNYKGSNGVHYAITGADSLIVINNQVLKHPIKKILTLGHEVGHALDLQVLSRMDPLIRKALLTQFLRWYQKGVQAKAFSPEAAAYKVSMREPVKSGFDEIDVKSPAHALDLMQKPAPGSWEARFVEWFAENTIKYMTTDKELMSPVEKLFQNYGQRLKELATIVVAKINDTMKALGYKGKLLDPTKADPIFRAFMDAHIKNDNDLMMNLIRWGVKNHKELSGEMQAYGEHSINKMLHWAQKDETFRGMPDVMQKAIDIVGREEFEKQAEAHSSDPEKLAELERMGVPEENRKAILVQEKSVEIVLDQLSEEGEKFSEMELGKHEATEEEKTGVRNYVKLVLGDKAGVEFIDKMKAAGEFIKGLSGEEMLHISTRALDKTATGYHEAAHALMARLMKTSPEAYRVLTRAANAPHIVAKLKELLKDHPKALEQLEDAEERVAYMYQFWASGQKGLLNIGPETAGFFEKIKQIFRTIASVWAEDMGSVTAVHRAGLILDAFHKGEFADPDTVAQVLRDRFPKNAVERANKAMTGLSKFMGRFVFTAQGVVRDMNYDATTGIMNQFYSSLGETGKSPGYLQTKGPVFNRFHNRITDVWPKYKAREMVVMDDLRSGQMPTTSEGKVIRQVLDDVWQYLKDSGVQTVVQLTREELKARAPGDNKTTKLEPLQRVTNYFPREFDQDFLRTAKGRNDFILLLKKYNLVNPGKIIENALRDAQAVEPGEEDASIGLTFFAPGTNPRALTIIPDAELAPFLEKDGFKTLGKYLYRVAKRGEYTKNFGNEGEKIEDARAAAIKEGMTADQAKLFDDSVRGMQGSLGANMSDKLRVGFGAMMTYQNIRLLPLQVLSSLIDPGGIAIRGGDLAYTFKAFSRGLAGMRRFKGDDAENLAKLVGSINAANDANLMSEMANSAYMTPTQKWLNDKFFKLNGMERWNNIMRVTATEAAVNFLIRHIEKPNGHSGRYLEELNLKKSDLKIENGRISNITDPKVAAAINQWVDEAILRPNPAHRPIYMNDPNWMLVSHLKQYTYLFQKVIIARVYHEAMNGNYTPAMVLGGYVPVMIAADMMRAALVPGNALAQNEADMGPMDWMWRGMQRVGLFGPSQFGIDAIGDPIHGQIPGISAAGPAIQQMGNFVAASVKGKGLGQESMKAIPIVNLWRDRDSWTSSATK